MRFQTRLVLFIAVTALPIACDKGAAPTTTAGSSNDEIRPIFRPDQPLYVEFKQDVSNVISEAGAPDVPTGLTRLYGMIMRTESVSPAETRLTFKLDRAGHSKRSMQLQKHFDSDYEGVVDDIGMATTYAPLLGLEYHVTLDAAGHVRETKNADLFEARIKEAKGGPIAQDALRDFADERMKMVWVEYPLALFPDHPVKVGDTWTNRITENFPIGKVELPHECRLEKITEEGGRKTAVVSFRGTMRPLEKGFRTVNGTKVQSYNFSFEGTAVYDYDLGQFTRRTQTNRTVLQYPGRPATPDQPPPMQIVTVSALQTYKVMTEQDRRAEKELHRRQPPPTTLPAGAAPASP